MSSWETSLLMRMSISVNRAESSSNSLKFCYIYFFLKAVSSGFLIISVS